MNNYGLWGKKKVTSLVAEGVSSTHYVATVVEERHCKRQTKCVGETCTVYAVVHEIFARSESWSLEKIHLLFENSGRDKLERISVVEKAHRTTHRPRATQ